MKAPDLDKVRSEEVHTLGDFLKLYNENLPLTFSRASAGLLEEFKTSHPDLFKANTWSLEQHRKRVMDWLQLKALEKAH